MDISEVFVAIDEKNTKIIKKALREGFNVNTQDNVGWTALHYACVEGDDIEIAKLLIDSGADVNMQDIDGWTTLHDTCYWGRIDIAKLLIDSGATITARDKDGDTPLDNLKSKHPQKYEELIQWLSEEYPEKALEAMASEKIQGKGIGL